MIKILWRTFSAVLAVILLLGGFSGSAAAAVNFSVGYYDYDDYFTIDEDNHITGYAGEILDMVVAANPHWNFVPVKFTRGDFLENMRKGFAAISVQSPFGSPSDNPRFFTYSEYPVGTEYGNFYTDPDREVYYEDFAAFEGMTVGAITGDMQNSLFSAYQKENAFSVEYEFFNTLDEMKRALGDGTIDGLIYGCVVEQAELKIIARYAEVPLHVAANQWGVEAGLIESFDRVLGGAFGENPYFLDELYMKYFDEAPRAVQALTEEEARAAEEPVPDAGEEAAPIPIEEEPPAETEVEPAPAAEDEQTVPAVIVDDEETNDKRMTQIGFIVVMALLVIAIAGTLMRKNLMSFIHAGKAAGKPSQAAKADKAAVRAAQFEEETAVKAAAEEAIAKAAEEARAKAAEEAAARATEEARRNAVDSVLGRFGTLADIDVDEPVEHGAPEYTDDQIRGEIYLSGLTISLQPRYSVDQNTIVGAEVSISCRHPIRDRVYPEELVNSLTQKAKLYVLDRYIFESLCLCKPQDKTDPADAFEIVVPVFTESVIRPDFSQWYIDAVKSHNVPAECFRLDLIYHWQPEQDQHVYRALNELAGAGFHVALKDVGNANYPLALLSEVEMDAIVVAEQLIVDALSNDKKKRLLFALKNLCAQMEFRMEADRIDSREKLQIMTMIGCQVFQGNFLTRAIPFDQFWEFKQRLETRLVS